MPFRLPASRLAGAPLRLSCQRGVNNDKAFPLLNDNHLRSQRAEVWVGLRQTIFCVLKNLPKPSCLGHGGRFTITCREQRDSPRGNQVAENRLCKTLWSGFHLPVNLWFMLNSGAGGAALNMALDEALLEAMPRLDRPVLRFYGWTEPAASFGYFQKFAEVKETTPWRPLLRRPTAGGIVPHDADWTYSLAFPPGHEWYSLRAEESYRRVHEWLQAAFARLGVETELAPSGIKIATGQCFAGHEKNDLLWHGKKIAGAAQRRTKTGLLIQGSVQPAVSWQRPDWEKVMCDTAEQRFGIRWRYFEPDTALAKRADELEQFKYVQSAYNQKR
jgi:lipoate-protein ligase A